MSCMVLIWFNPKIGESSLTKFFFHNFLWKFVKNRIFCKKWWFISRVHCHNQQGYCKLLSVFARGRPYIFNSRWDFQCQSFAKTAIQACVSSSITVQDFVPSATLLICADNKLFSVLLNGFIVQNLPSVSVTSYMKKISIGIWLSKRYFKFYTAKYWTVQNSVPSATGEYLFLQSTLEWTNTSVVIFSKAHMEIQLFKLNLESLHYKFTTYGPSKSMSRPQPMSRPQRILWKMGLRGFEPLLK